MDWRDYIVIGMMLVGAALGVVSIRKRWRSKVLASRRLRKLMGPSPREPGDL